LERKSHEYLHKSYEKSQINSLFFLQNRKISVEPHFDRRPEIGAFAQRSAAGVLSTAGELDL
jgi:hypothetical protein